MIIPYLNSASYNAIFRSGFLRNEMANNTNVIGIKSEIKTDSEKGDINSINSAAEIMAVLEVQYLQNSPISKIRSATKNHLETRSNNREIKISDASEKTESPNSSPQLIISQEEKIKSSIGKGFLIFDPRFNTEKTSKYFNTNFVDKVKEAFNLSRREKTGSLLDLKL